MFMKNKVHYELYLHLKRMFSNKIFTIKKYTCSSDKFIFLIKKD